jgi:VPDSG-CTERM exosortase interaction domain
MKIRTIPTTKLALVCAALVAALFMFADKASAVSIRDAHELGSVQSGVTSRHSEGSTYINHLIGMALRGDERANGQYFRSDYSTRHALLPDPRNGWNAQGRSIEVIRIPNPGGVPGSGTGVPDGGITAMLLGTALGALGMARRYMMS